MDWTGGVRRRFAPGKDNATRQKQKAHFARARITLHNTTSSKRSFRPDFLGNATATKATSEYSRARNFHVGRDIRERSSAIPWSRKGSGQRDGQGRLYGSPNEEQYPTYHEKQGRHRSPSVIYIGSSDHSSPASSTVSRVGEKQRKSPNPFMSEVVSMTEEDRLLLANRRRLLARTDWLGLAPTRPVQMKFPSSRDKARIGKRRKVESSASRKGKPAGQRLVTPLFEERLILRQPMMSRAVLPEDIQVRIGTDALTSQTQRSRQSRTPGKTSVRQPSTEFGPLSEEPMLLGADGDSLEAMQSPNRVARSPELMGLHARSPLFVDSQGYGGEQHVPERPEMRSALDQSKFDEQLQLSEIRNPCHHDLILSDRVPDSEPLRYTSHAAPKVVIGVHTPAQEQYGDPLSTKPLEANHATGHQALNLADSDVDDEEAWRRLLNIEHRDSSHASMAALKSSSLHLTTSESHQRPPLHIASRSIADSQPITSTPKGTSTQASVIRRPQDIAENFRGSDPLEHLQSPSASLQQIVKLAQQPAPSKRTEDNGDENALWRQFVCGSQDGSEDFPLSADVDGERHNTARHSAPLGIASSLFDISDLGTSNEATIGEDTLFVSENTSSAPGLARNKADLKDSRHSARLPGSNVAQGGTSAHNEDIIEDDQPIATSKLHKNNLHVSAARVLNPRRFKRPQKQVAPAPLRSNQFRPPRLAKRRDTTNVHSVYDLVDSDGVSIA